MKGSALRGLAGNGYSHSGPYWLTIRFSLPLIRLPGLPLLCLLQLYQVSNICSAGNEDVLELAQRELGGCNITWCFLDEAVAQPQWSRGSHSC